MAKKKEPTKKIKKKITGYERILKKHQEKKEKYPDSPANPHWDKEIEGFQKKIDKYNKQLEKRKGQK